MTTAVLWKKLSVYFSEVEGPGVERRCLHLLTDMLMISLLTYLTGGTDYPDMHFHQSALNAWISENRLCTGQEKAEEKSNEITAIPQVLSSRILKKRQFPLMRQVLKQRQGKTLIICKETDFIPGVYILQIRKKTQIINRKMIVC
jgi:hypothetical protein